MFAVRTVRTAPWCATRRRAPGRFPLVTYCLRAVARNWHRLPVTETDVLALDWCPACWRIVGDQLKALAYAQRQGGPAIARRIAEAHGLFDGAAPRLAARVARPPAEKVTP